MPIETIRPQPGSPADQEAKARIRAVQLHIRAMIPTDAKGWQSIACYAMTLEMARLLKALSEDERFAIMEHYIQLLQREVLS